MPFLPDGGFAMPVRHAAYSHYQSDLALAKYCDAHYGPDKFGVGNFSAALVRHCLAQLQETPRRSALDLGCAVGRSSFELAVQFDRVVAIDYSARFIELARRIQKKAVVQYSSIEEGVVLSDHRVTLAELGLAETAGNVTFEQGDALELNNEYLDFDLILAANLIDRLPRPAKFLSSIHERLSPGGLLAIATPYDWQDSFTPQKYWLGGQYAAGSAKSGFKEMEKLLSKRFSLVGAPLEQELLIRQTARTFQHSICQITLWRYKA
jgi:putative 4-mercaptohistidine N1-methyltranferase